MCRGGVMAGARSVSVERTEEKEAGDAPRDPLHLSLCHWRHPSSSLSLSQWGWRPSLRMCVSRTKKNHGGGSLCDPLPARYSIAVVVPVVVVSLNDKIISRIKKEEQTKRKERREASGGASGPQLSYTFLRSRLHARQRWWW
jgi:hypothetical protein